MWNEISKIKFEELFETKEALILNFHFSNIINILSVEVWSVGSRTGTSSPVVKSKYLEEGEPKSSDLNLQNFNQKNKKKSYWRFTFLVYSQVGCNKSLDFLFFFLPISIFSRFIGLVLLL